MLPLVVLGIECTVILEAEFCIAINVLSSDILTSNGGGERDEGGTMQIADEAIRLGKDDDADDEGEEEDSPLLFVTPPLTKEGKESILYFLELLLLEVKANFDNNRLLEVAVPLILSFPLVFE